MAAFRPTEMHRIPGVPFRNIYRCWDGVNLSPPGTYFTNTWPPRSQRWAMHDSLVNWGFQTHLFNWNPNLVAHWLNWNMMAPDFWDQAENADMLTGAGVPVDPRRIEL